MSGYQVETSTHRVGGRDYQVRGLLDRQQFDDPDGLAELAGISSAQWALFGVMWPSGLALAAEMADFPVAGKRVLELGCGLGLASLILQGRGVEVIASDHHPLAASFLAHNARINGITPVDFRAVAWAGPNPLLGDFDLVIGSDLLYERGHPALLAGFIESHARVASEVVFTDPGRGNRGRFTTALVGQGYALDDRRVAFGAEPHGHVLTFSRG